MKYNIDKITRVYAIRVLFWENNHESIFPYSFITGKNSDGTYYFRNPYTELPNELNRRQPEYIKDIFENVVNVLDKIENHPVEQEVHHADEIWNFHIWYQNGEEEVIKCENLVVRFDFVDDNDIILSGEICDGNIFCRSMITLDELRDEIKCGYVSFDKFYHFFERENIAGDEESLVEYKVNWDGSVNMYSGTVYAPKEFRFRSPSVVIDKDGYIVEDGNMYYIAKLKESGVRVILK